MGKTAAGLAEKGAEKSSVIVKDEGLLSEHDYLFGTKK